MTITGSTHEIPWNNLSRPERERERHKQKRIFVQRMPKLPDGNQHSQPSDTTVGAKRSHALAANTSYISNSIACKNQLYNSSKI